MMPISDRGDCLSDLETPPLSKQSSARGLRIPLLVAFARSRTLFSSSETLRAQACPYRYLLPSASTTDFTFVLPHQCPFDYLNLHVRKEPSTEKYVGVSLYVLRSFGLSFLMLMKYFRYSIANTSLTLVVDVLDVATRRVNASCLCLLKINKTRRGYIMWF